MSRFSHNDAYSVSIGNDTDDRSPSMMATLMAPFQRYHSPKRMDIILLAFEVILLMIFCSAALRSVEPPQSARLEDLSGAVARAIADEKRIVQGIGQVEERLAAATVYTEPPVTRAGSKNVENLRADVEAQLAQLAGSIQRDEGRVRSVMRSHAKMLVQALVKLYKNDKKHRKKHPLLGDDDALENQHQGSDADDADVTDLPGPAFVHPHDPLSDISDPVVRNTQRRAAVVQEFNHSWNAYVQYAWGDDELKPISKVGRNWSEHGSLGLSILDASTTIALMGLETELQRVVDYISNHWSIAVPVDMSQFESVIRIVGSLVSLYQLTGEQHHAILDKAAEAADHILPAYNTAHGLPDTAVNFLHRNHSNPNWRQGCTAVAEAGTCQIEFRTLTMLTNLSRYDKAGTRAFTAIEKGLPVDGLVPVFINTTTGRWATRHLSIGGLADSYYEYLLKQYLLTNRTELRYKLHFKKAVNSIIDKLLQYSNETKTEFTAFLKCSL